MNGDQIRNAATQYVGVKCSNDTAIVIINEALALISDQSLISATIEVEAKAETWYKLPNDATSIQHITTPEGNYYKNYKLQGQQIMFLDEGKYELTLRRQPEPIETLAVVPEIHPLFHQSLVTYFKAYLKLQVNDESNDGLRLMGQFEEQVSRAFNILRRNQQPIAWQVIRHA